MVEKYVGKTTNEKNSDCDNKNEEQSATERIEFVIEGNWTPHPHLYGFYCGHQCSWTPTQPTACSLTTATGSSQAQSVANIGILRLNCVNGWWKKYQLLREISITVGTNCYFKLPTLYLFQTCNRTDAMDLFYSITSGYSTQWKC